MEWLPVEERLGKTPAGSHSLSEKEKEMTGAIPKYGKNFRLEHVARDFENDLASRIYVRKEFPRYYIRSNGNSEKWSVFYSHPGQHDLVKSGFHTLTEAMQWLLDTRG